MRTELDLRAAMDVLATGAPTGADALARLHEVERTSRLRRWAPAVAAAATVVVVSIVAAVLAATGARHHTAAAGGEPGPSAANPCASDGHVRFTGIRLSRVDGLADTARSEQSCSGFADRELDSTSGSEVGRVEIFREGVFDTKLLSGGSRVSGSGLDGYKLKLRIDQLAINQSDAPDQFACAHSSAAPPSNSTRGGNLAGGTQCGSMNAVAWQYAPGSWGLVAESDTPEAAALFGADATTKLLDIAAATDTAHPAIVRVPVQAVSSLPEGVRVVDVDLYATAKGRLVSAVVGLGRTGESGCPADLACSQLGEIVLTPSSHRPALAGEPVVVGGQTAYLTDEGESRPDITVQLWHRPWRVLVGEGSDRQLTDQSLIDIARMLRYAPSSTDRAGWFDVNEAFSR